MKPLIMQNLFPDKYILENDTYILFYAIIFKIQFPIQMM